MHQQLNMLVTHLTAAELEAGLGEVLRSPRDAGELQLIVRRPRVGQRDLSQENLPAGTRLAIGSAVLEVTSQPHTGCGKFVERFGLDAMRFVNSLLGRRLSLRGINARVVQNGTIRRGDVARKI